MALTLSDKSRMRMHLKYPTIGIFSTLANAPGGGTLASGSVGWRFFESAGMLEFRMNNLAPDEESRLLGKAFGSIALLGVDTVIGSNVSITISGGGLVSNQIVSYTAVASDNRLSVISQLANLANQNQTLTNAGFIAFSPYGTGIFPAIVIPVPEWSITNSTSFSISVTSTNNIGAAVTSNGLLISPSAIVDQSTIPPTTIYGYLNILDYLYGSVAGATQNMDTNKADVWTARHDEKKQRVDLYKWWQNELAQFVGIPLGTKGGMSGSAAYSQSPRVNVIV